MYFKDLPSTKARVTKINATKKTVTSRIFVKFMLLRCYRRLIILCLTSPLYMWFVNQSLINMLKEQIMLMYR